MGVYFRKKYKFATPKSRIMNKVLVISCFILMAFGACKRETKDERFQREFLQFTQKECPKFVDEWTKLDSAVYDIESRTLTYFYTVKGELDDEAVYTNEQMISDFHDTILKGLKGSLQLKVYKDESISFRYNYCSETTGKQYLEFTFTPEDYN